MKQKIKDPKLKKAVEDFYKALEAYYPEHKVFALDSIDNGLREKLTKLYKETGTETMDEFLLAGGFEPITGKKVKEIRSHVIYAPGKEPDVIKGKVDSMLRRLCKYYPDKVIAKSIQNEHKKLSQSVSGLYQWLGYADAKEMLEAYGFKVEYGESGRPANDYQVLLDALQEKYCGDHKARSMNQIILENPEYTGSIKTLSNTANERFGMSFAKYLKQIGVIRSGTEQAVETGGRCHFLWVTVDGENERIPCLTKSRALHGGELIEMCAPNDGKKAVGKVVQTSYYMKEKDLPCPMEKMYRYERRLSGEERKEAESLRKKYILCTIAGTAQYAFRCISTKEDLEIGDAVTVNNGRDGRIMSMKRISEKEAPEPIKKMPRVLAITDSLAEKRERSILQIEELEQKMGTEVFTRKEVDPQIRETMEQITYFSGVVLRGLADDIETIWHKLYLNPHFVEIRRGTEKYKVLLKADRKLSDSKRKIRKEVGQLACCNRLIRQVLTEYPRLKVICFAENWKTGEVYLAYSESGYDSFTSLRYLGKCDFRQRDHWTQIHDPAEDGFGFEGGRYTFEEKEAWEAFDYVLADGKRKLKAASPLPAAPYKKITSQTPSSIIKINN